METIRTTYLGNLRTSALHVKSGETLVTDAPTDNKGLGQAFSPTDLMSASLGSCMLTIMGIAARTHSIELNQTEIKITKIMAENPRRVAEIVVEFDFPEKVYFDKEKVILENAARTCPVALSLHPDLKQTVKFNWK
jgi:putative redox protein